MARKTKGLYAKHDETKVKQAVQEVKAGHLSIRQAAVKYNISKSTLGDKVSGRAPTGIKTGRAPVFPIAVETELVQKAQTLAEQGFGISRQQMMAKASRLATNMRLKTPFNRGIPGQAWWDGFVKRNPTMVLRKPEKLATIRARNMNAATLHNYLNDLSKCIEDLGLADHPKRIWNMDETGVQMEHSPIAVCARKGARNVPGRVSNSRESVTVVPCVNAEGEAMPPLIIVRGKTPKSLNGFNKSEGPNNAIWSFQGKAWIDDSGIVHWFTEIFLKNCGNERPQLVILDQHVSHEALDLLEIAKKEHIHLFALPPHTTHYLCPLDRTVFGPLKKHYNAICSDFMSKSSGNMVMKWNWPGLFKGAYEAAFTVSNIKKGFKACGIHPFDPSAIPSFAIAPSVPSDEKENCKQVPVATESSDTANNNKESDVTLETTDDATANLQLLSDIASGDMVLAEASSSIFDVSFPVPTSSGLFDLSLQVPLPMVQVDNVISDSIADMCEITNATPQKSVIEDVITPPRQLVTVDVHKSKSFTLTANDPMLSSTIVSSPDESLSADWNSEINTLFELQPASKTKQKGPQRKRPTCHRLLTSDDGIAAKKIQQTEKEQKKQMKEINAEKRKEKALQGFLKKMK